MAVRADCCGDTRTDSAATTLTLAASPVFAAMALGTVIYGGDAICSVMPPSPFSGMAAMYALMAVFHAAPWLRLLRRHTALSSRARRSAKRCDADPGPDRPPRLLQIPGWQRGNLR